MEGKLIAHRIELKDSLDVMSSYQHETLLDRVSALLTRLNERWSDDLLDFRTEILNELKII